MKKKSKKDSAAEYTQAIDPAPQGIHPSHALYNVTNGNMVVFTDPSNDPESTIATPTLHPRPPDPTPEAPSRTDTFGPNHPARSPLRLLRRRLLGLLLVLLLVMRVAGPA